LTFAAESQLIAAGHDCQPVLFTGSAEGWSLSHSLDDSATSGKALTPTATGNRVPSGGGGVGRLNNEAFNRFKAADSRGQTKPSGGSQSTGAGVIAVGSDGQLLTVHQNSITWVEAYEWGSNGEVSKISTAGKDGRLVIWPVTGKPAPGGLAGRMGNLQM
jgi:actin related protein 2/3 complex subunit 1A/1B